LDITDIGLGNSMLEDYYFVGSDPRAVFASTLRLGITDSNGIANFLKLSVVDVQSNVNIYILDKLEYMCHLPSSYRIKR
jgi:hypothetical protein